VEISPGEKATLTHDLSILQSYANLYPESFTGLRIDGSRIRMAFADDLDRHRNAISATLHNPDALTFEEAPLSRRALQSIRAEVVGAWRNDHRQPLMGDGLGYSTVLVHLRPPFEGLAQELHRRYGDSLEITVGFKRFPPGGSSDAANYVKTPQEILVSRHIELKVGLIDDVVCAGDDLRGQVWLTNKRPQSINIETGAIASGGIRRPHCDQISGWFSGALSAAGVNLRLAPEECGPIALVVGTASCDSTDLYVPTPGLYEAVARVPVRVSSADGWKQEGEMLARGATLTVR
jgi:hypothetical protein